MKIAYILDLFPVFSETFIVREILELERQGFEILVFARGDTRGRSFSEVVHDESNKLMRKVLYFPSLQNRLSEVQLAVYHLYFLLLNPIRYLKTFLFSFNCGERTFKLFQRSVLYAMNLKRNGVRHIHAHFALDACKLAMLTSMLTSIPYSFTAHAHDIFIPKLSDLMVEKFNRAKFAACISEYNKKYILENYPKVAPGNIRIIHCGIGIATLTPGTKQVHKNFTILAVGRLVEQKGFKYLLQACEQLRRRQGLNFVCNIIGEGKDRQILEELISKCGLTEVVRLLGAREQRDVINAMKSADLFVLPCVVDKNGSIDGIPVVLMEAMAMGIPVISTRLSGIPELIKDGAGILVEPEDVNGLETAMETILRLPDEEREAMGRRGRAIVEQDFNLKTEAYKLAELYRS